ncbi:MAG TPA: hypothetical protein EYP19_00570 [Desulfobacterales bacterium]|nr:hypothetical protein [Desulfobacterales bacterium]
MPSKTIESRKVRTASAQLPIAPEKLLSSKDNNLFVSKYQLELPKKEEMEKFLEKQLKEVADGR